MQGQLRKEKLSFLIETTCAHCGQPLHIQIDSDLQYTVQESTVFPNPASPLVFVPSVDFDKLQDPSIIDAF